ncbi:DUF2524 domain-containing protein [Paenibacillus hamazuiensis]|uniref:DUF2524 domain-containing protein n=1 Tax=Paenibacillus hamazuiensis TaxID=2936508 RepID=UPI00200D55E0|nr:DUF2524 domain-containing protein [Paenibacillus hamazuiensis]
MIDNLESNYDCARAGDDLQQLQNELAALKSGGEASKEAQEQINRLINQISFIRNKCDIH